MSCCGNGNSLFTKNTNARNIKFTCTPSGAALTVTQGSQIVASIDLCMFNKNYSQYVQTQMFLEAGALHREIPYGGLGTQVMFLFVKVEYIKKGSESTFPVPFSGSTEIPTISYIFETNTSIVRYIDDLMILTGTDNNRIPKVFLSNPSVYHDAVVTVLASTTRITFDDVTSTDVGDDVITVEHLTYKSLTSDANKLNVTSTSGTVLSMRWQDITFNSSSGDVELNGKIITISDYVKGTINLSFIDDYNARQGYSLIKWALCDVAVNILLGDGNITDDTPPVIHYKPEFTTDIVLADFPPLMSSTCGISGSSACPYNYVGTHGLGVIYKEDLFEFLALNATDNRDCYVPFDVDNLTIRLITSVNTTDTITETGLYQLTFYVYDNAGNEQLDSFILNVKDTTPPRMVVSELGFNLIELPATTAGQYTFLGNNNYVYLGIDSTSFDFRIDGVDGHYGYVVIDGIAIEVGSYVLSSVLYTVFDNQMVGNGKLIWNTDTDMNVEKIFILNSKYYVIKWEGFGSLLFNLTQIDYVDLNKYVVDEDDNYIVDEYDNYLSF